MRKTVLITGAIINTGVAIVEKFAIEGWDVVFTGRNAEKVGLAEENYKKKFPHVTISGYAVNALKDERTVNEEAVENLFLNLDKKEIYVSCLVLNAAEQGIGIKVFENPLVDFMKVINTNIAWNYCIVEHATKRMRERRDGSIIFINSNTSYRAIPDRIAYSASKSGQLGMMRALALDLGKYNIRVNAVLPGMIKTDRWEKNTEFYEKVPSRYTPLGDVAVGKDVADGVYYFAANARNTTGAELIIDGGNMIQLYPIINKS